MVSHRRKETPECKPQSGKPLVRPSMFDGKGSWEDYQALLDIVATLNGWTDDRLKATYLAVSLGGAARAVLGDLSEAERGSTKWGLKLWTTGLGQGTGQKYTVLPSNQEPGRKMSPCPSWLRPSQNLPASPSRASHVIFGIPWPETISSMSWVMQTCWNVHQSHPKTLNDALTIAVELEAFLTVDLQRGCTARAARAIPKTTARQNSGQENFQ